MTVESKYPNSATILASDFKKLDLTSAAKSFHLKPIIDFPIRGANTLDHIFTNIAEYYSPPVSAPPFGLSDHLTVTVSPGIREKLSKPKLKVIKTRDKGPSKIASVGRFLLQVSWSDLFSLNQSCEDKLSILTEIVNYGLDTIMPERSVRVHEIHRPRMNSRLKALIARRQKALATNNVLLIKILRNKVNRERKRCRTIYYENKVKGPRDTKPRVWWRKVKQLCGTAKATGRNLSTSLHPSLVYDDSVLSEKTNEGFVSVMQGYSLLSENVLVASEDNEPLLATEATVARKLRAVSTSRVGDQTIFPTGF